MECAKARKQELTATPAVIVTRFRLRLCHPVECLVGRGNHSTPCGKVLIFSQELEGI